LAATAEEEGKTKSNERPWKTAKGEQHGNLGLERVVEGRVINQPKNAVSKREKRERKKRH